MGSSNSLQNKSESKIRQVPVLGKNQNQRTTSFGSSGKKMKNQRATNFG
jgi:hypothetical protein